MQRLITYIVEDSAVILENLVATLEELAPVQVVGSAREEEAAVQWLLEPGQACDLIVLDVYLRSGSGLGVLERLAGARAPGRRVILTNYATPDIRDKCARLGAHHVFDKSSELDELIAYCRRLAAERADAAPVPSAGAAASTSKSAAG